MADEEEKTETEYLKEIIELQKITINQSEDIIESCSIVIDENKKQEEAFRAIILLLKNSLSLDTERNIYILEEMKEKFKIIDENFFELLMTLAKSETKGK
jgi:hypothetical protein